MAKDIDQTMAFHADLIRRENIKQLLSDVEEALKDADRDGIKGKDTTPYLLAKITEITGGGSLDANIELVYNNAHLGAKIAKELSSER